MPATRPPRPSPAAPAAPATQAAVVPAQQPAPPSATYDPSVDAYYLFWTSRADIAAVVPAGTRRVDTREVAPGIYLDFGPDERLLGIEVLDASHRLPAGVLAAAGSADGWLTLPEAAAEAELSPTTLRVQIRNGRLEARKQGRDWLVSRAALETYLINRDPRGASPGRSASGPATTAATPAPDTGTRGTTRAVRAARTRSR